MLKVGNMRLENNQQTKPCHNRLPMHKDLGKNDLHNKKILLVEDDHFNQKMMQHLFYRWKVDADVSGNGKEAINNLRRQSYDLVLMDIEMPEMNGFETVRYMREVLKLDVPVIAVTGNTALEDLQTAMECGMQDLITKPFDPGFLYSKILSHIETK
jgi:two-component system CheB/CheR fusion protein